ncbi:alpha-galactosidase [Capsulimonas corticalis]|uniref:alpha-galactosidase n=1 Tax=Capsulimonas corticalis TaxID=2219043 RepID=A0A402CU25_9BACT|nr:alpha-galactosidase [Capsulimonas corticalis]BDI28830.1 alpha-galactosidase [Capsulimonas corticalis]
MKLWKRRFAGAVLLATGLVCPPSLDARAAGVADGAGGSVLMEDLDLRPMTTGWGIPMHGKSIEGKPLTIGGRTFTHGVGAHANSLAAFQLNGQCNRFLSTVGVDDEVGAGRGSIEFRITADGAVRWRSGVMRFGDPAKNVDLDLTGAKTLVLEILDCGDGTGYDHGDWADARFEMKAGQPTMTHDPRQIWISTAHTALVLLPGDDKKLNQIRYGAATNTAADAGNAPMEYYPPAGDGPVGEPALRVTHADGNTSTDLVFVSSTTKAIDSNVTQTQIELKDPEYPLFVTLFYKAYQKEDVIETWTEIRHEESKPVTLYNFASCSPVFAPGDYWLTQYHGDWANEMNVSETKLDSGVKILDSKYGMRTELARNPTFLLSAGGPSKEDSGEVIGGALAWSGNFQFAFEVDQRNRLRALCGMNPYASEYHLKPNTPFVTPSMIWSWSGSGKGELSRNFHRWGRAYGMRDGDKLRPTLLNNWEATFFDFDEKKLVSLFDGAKSLGMDLFLLDDGWFGNKYPRKDDTQGLGDWEVTHSKLPHGITYLADQAKARGIRFGIWVEPEMVNPKSELFEKHPDWVIRQPKRDLKFERNQLTLDLTRPAVREFAFHMVDDLLTQNPGISYIKWDCNRGVAQPGSPYLPANEQSHLWIEYVRALYDIFARLEARHPNVELMQCSSGGGRTDYGALRFAHEFWPSDNTNPDNRVMIQWAYSQFYPAIAQACHVTTAGSAGLKFAFDVAMSGRLGMDVDIDKLSPEDRRFAAAAVQTYDSLRDIVQFGDIYRLQSPLEGTRSTLMYVSDDKKRAVLFAYQMKDGDAPTVALQGLNPTGRYTIRERNLREGVASKLAQNGQTIDGETLMKTGLALPVSKTHDSVVVEVAEE